jgi:hypothetical protein
MGLVPYYLAWRRMPGGAWMFEVPALFWRVLSGWWCSTSHKVRIKVIIMPNEDAADKLLLVASSCLLTIMSNPRPRA